MTCRSPYDNDLTDPECAHLKPLVPVVKWGGRPPIHSRREILNGDLLRSPQWMCLETAAARSAAVANCLSLLLVMASQRDMAEDSRQYSCIGAGSSRPTSGTERCGCRQSISTDC